MDSKQSPYCLVVFPTHFNPNNSLLISLQISLLFMCTLALRRVCIPRKDKASWIHSYFDNAMTTFVINNRTDAWKTDVNLWNGLKFTFMHVARSSIHLCHCKLHVLMFPSLQISQRTVFYSISKPTPLRNCLNIDEKPFPSRSSRTNLETTPVSKVQQYLFKNKKCHVHVNLLHR